MRSLLRIFDTRLLNAAPSLNTSFKKLDLHIVHDIDNDNDFLNFYTLLMFS